MKRSIKFLMALILSVFAWACPIQLVHAQGYISTYAGSPLNDGKPATQATLSVPSSVTIDKSGNLYIADQGNQRIRKMDASTGIISTIAGNGNSGFGGDGGLATAAQLYSPSCLAVDNLGNLYIADQGNNRIRKVDKAAGIISTIAGNGISGFGGDGGPATAAQLDSPLGLAFDNSGNLYIADTYNNRIRKVDKATGIISTIVGNGISGFSGDGEPATAAQLDSPSGLAFDNASNLYITDFYSNRIRKVDKATGIISTIAGNGNSGFGGDGGPATAAQLYFPSGLAVDNLDNLYIADQGNNRIRKVDKATGIISSMAGNGTFGFGGDGGVAALARLSGPSGISLDNYGNVYIADRQNYRIRKMDASTGIISTIAGNGTFGFSGDGGPATAAQLDSPLGLAFDNSGNLYIADTYNNRIRKVDKATGMISTIAGNGISGFSGDGGPATAAQLDLPSGLAFDNASNLYITDFYSNRIRKIDISTGIISTIAGNGILGFGGDGGPATSAKLDSPEGLACDNLGNLYFIDGGNYRIRKVDKVTGFISTVAGNGNKGSGGDGGSAIAANLDSPSSITIDNYGNLYIAEIYNNQIRKVDKATGIIRTIAGNGTFGFSGDGGPATAAQFFSPLGLAFDNSGNLYIADTYNDRIRKFSLFSGVIVTIAGDGTEGFSGDGGLASLAQLNKPSGIVLDADGNLYFSDRYNHCIRKVSFPVSANVITALDGLNAQQELLIYPNPTEDILTVKTTLGKNYHILVMDAGGKTMMELEANQIQEDYSFSVRELPKGLYILRIFNGQQTQVTRFVKQ